MNDCVEVPYSKRETIYISVKKGGKGCTHMTTLNLLRNMSVIFVGRPHCLATSTPCQKGYSLIYYVQVINVNGYGYGHNNDANTTNDNLLLATDKSLGNNLFHINNSDINMAITHTK